MNVRIASKTDLPQVAQLFDQYREFYNQPSDLSAARLFLEERIRNQESVIFVATSPEDSAKLIGFVQLYFSFSSVSLKRVFILNDLFVDPSSRGTGVGEALMKTAMEFSKSTGAKGLNLMTAIDNVSAQKLYEKLGWKRNENYYTYNLNH